MSDSNYNRNACIKFFKIYKDCKSKQVHQTLFISVVTFVSIHDVFPFRIVREEEVAIDTELVN